MSIYIYLYICIYHVYVCTFSYIHTEKLHDSQLKAAWADMDCMVYDSNRVQPSCPWNTSLIQRVQP